MRKHSLFFGLAAIALLLLPNTVLAKGNPNAVPGSPAEPIYEILVEYDLPITLRDGTVLYADVYRPDAEGQFPVLLGGTPYGKIQTGEKLYETDTYFVPRGYVLVVYDVRGQWASEGRFDRMHTAGLTDGYDVVEWAAAQPWSSGRVGLLGNSMDGQVVMQTVAANPPHLTCAAPSLTAKDLWQEWYYRGGAMEFGFDSSWFGRSNFASQTALRYLSEEEQTNVNDTWALAYADPEYYAMALPVVDYEPAATVPPEWNKFREWALHPTEDAYWISNSPGTYFSQFSVPMLHIGGWYDCFQYGTLKSFVDLQSQAGTELARENQRLFVGPWFHLGLGFHSQVLAGYDFGPNLTNPNFNDVRAAFFDYWMKDVQTELYDVDYPVRYFTIGENQWHTATNWPLPNTNYVNYYFGGTGGSGAVSLYDGSLSASAPAVAEASASYVYDPMDPIPTVGGTHLQSFAYGPDGSVLQGIQEQSAVDKRSLTFTSAPLEADLEITGPITAVLYAASSAVDTDWVVRLNEVKADGSSWVIEEGILRARFRDSNSHPTLLEPGEIYEFEVNLWATSYVVPKGSSLRVTVNSSSFPRWSRNLNVAEYPEQATEWVVANNTIYFDAEHPSHVILPIIPR